MPTNKLWLEHTEKAAWDSVQALRDKVAEAERRIERLGPPIAAWQPLLDELDRARSEFDLGDEAYVEVLRAVLERAARDKERVAELEREQERAKRIQQSQQSFDVTSLTQRPSYQPFGDDDDDFFQSRRETWLEHDLERRRSELLADHALPEDADALLRLIDARVADLLDVDGMELTDAALDLAVFALTLATLRDDSE